MNLGIENEKQEFMRPDRIFLIHVTVSPLVLVKRVFTQERANP